MVSLTGASSAARDAKKAAREGAALVSGAYDAAAGELDPFASYELQAAESYYPEAFDPAAYDRLARNIDQDPIFMESQRLAQQAVESNPLSGIYSGNRAEGLRQAAQGAFMQAYGARTNAYDKYMARLQDAAQGRATGQRAAYNIGSAQARAGGMQNVANINMGQANRRTQLLGDVLGAATTIGGAMIGGPAGAAIGSQIGGAASSPIMSMTPQSNVTGVAGDPSTWGYQSPLGSQYSF